MVVFAAVGVDIALRVSYAGEILPGTRVAGLDVGGMSRSAATAALAAAFSGDRTVTLVYGDRRFSVRASDVGYRVNAASSAERAYRTGRGNGMGGLSVVLAGLRGTRNVEPVVHLRTSRLRTVVAEVAQQLDRPPFHGSLAVVGSSATIRAVAPRAGRALEQHATATLIAKAFTRRDRRVIPLPVRRRAAISRAYVEAVARTAQKYVETPLRLRAPRRTVMLDRTELVAVLALERTRTHAGPPVRLGVDAARLQRLVIKLARRYNRDPVDARLDAPTHPVTVDAHGDLIWRPRPAAVRVTPARTGRRVDVTATTASLAAAIRGQRHAARLTFARDSASLTTSAARKVTSILGTFTSRFACCQPRTTNIQLIAKAVDQTIIGPGEEFSLNRTAGPRTLAKGYKPAPFIADGQIVPSVGGGVSQLSTAMYNAAYFAGLRIDRHQPHSFYIDRYPAGREATVDYPSIDLVWTNDTSTPVLVRATADATSVTVTLYGNSLVRRVESRSGPRASRNGGGFTITVTRIVTYRGRGKARHAFTTRYDAPPAER